MRRNNSLEVMSEMAVYCASKISSETPTLRSNTCTTILLSVPGKDSACLSMKYVKCTVHPEIPVLLHPVIFYDMEASMLFCLL